jgi:hypothetical protein
MKKHLLLFAVLMLASCGPHRMGCGARYFDTPEKQEVQRPVQAASVKV